MAADSRRVLPAAAAAMAGCSDAGAAVTGVGAAVACVATGRGSDATLCSPPGGAEAVASALTLKVELPLLRLLRPQVLPGLPRCLGASFAVRATARLSASGGSSLGEAFAGCGGGHAVPYPAQPLTLPFVGECPDASSRSRFVSAVSSLGLSTAAAPRLVPPAAPPLLSPLAPDGVALGPPDLTGCCNVTPNRRTAGAAATIFKRRPHLRRHVAGAEATWGSPGTVLQRLGRLTGGRRAATSRRSSHQRSCRLARPAVWQCDPAPI